MGFYPQPEKHTCGPFALKHALIGLGRFVTEQEISRVARPHWWAGTDEIRLARAARAFECDLPTVRVEDAEDARRTLNEHVQRRVPVLMCVDNWEHWITVLRRVSGQRYVVVDSAKDPVLGLESWASLRRRWRYLDYTEDEDDPTELYDLMPVQPRFRAPMRADFSAARVKFLRRPAHHSLAAHWDDYVEDLAAICRPRSAGQARPLSMGEFLRRHQELIQSRIVFWHGEVQRGDVARQLQYFRFVAETYGLVIPASASRRALVDLTALIMLWVASDNGVASVYGTRGTAPIKPKHRNSKRRTPHMR